MMEFIKNITQEFVFQEMLKNNLTEVGYRESYDIYKIFEELKLKTFIGNLQCYCCGKYFNPYKINMHSCGEVVMFGFNKEEEVIAPPHFLCEDCHNLNFGVDNFEND